jgi:hypothetical protein
LPLLLPLPINFPLILLDTGTYEVLSLNPLFSPAETGSITGGQNMAIDGTYKVEVSSPRGVQAGELTIKTSGNTCSGVYKTQRGDQAFTGTVDGNTAKWTINVQSPMGSMAIGYNVTVTGNDLTGTVSMGQFGNAPIKGTKTA